LVDECRDDRYSLTGNADKACKRDAHGRRCEIDHLVSRELGGDDDRSPTAQAMECLPQGSYRESRLHKEVCAGNISLQMRKRKSHTQTRPAQNIANRLKT
jgi:hypothetical protein